MTRDSTLWGTRTQTPRAVRSWGPGHPPHVPATLLPGTPCTYPPTQRAWYGSTPLTVCLAGVSWVLDPTVRHGGLVPPYSTPWGPDTSLVHPEGPGTSLVHPDGDLAERCIGFGLRDSPNPYPSTCPVTDPPTPGPLWPWGPLRRVLGEVSGTSRVPLGYLRVVQGGLGYLRVGPGGVWEALGWVSEGYGKRTSLRGTKDEQNRHLLTLWIILGRQQG